MSNPSKNIFYKIAPQLVLDYDEKFQTYPCAAAPKLDGICAIYNNGVFYSREGHIWKPSVVKHLKDKLANVAPYHILIGEFYKHGWTLPRINSAIAVTRIEPTEDTPEIDFYAHNLLSTEMPDLIMQDRIQIMCNKKYNHVGFKFIPDKKALYDYYNLCISQGYEGIVIYNLKATYSCDSRNGNIMRMKPVRECDARCIGFKYGDKSKKYANVIGALMMETFINGDHIRFEVSSGLSDKERLEYSTRAGQDKARTLYFHIGYERVSEDKSLLKPRILNII